MPIHDRYKMRLVWTKVVVQKTNTAIAIKSPYVFYSKKISPDCALTICDYNAFSPGHTENIRMNYL